MARATRWTPARRDGRSVDAWVLLTLGFPSRIHPIRTERPAVIERQTPHVRLMRTPSPVPYAVAGRLVSETTGAPIAGARIYLVGTAKGTLTDADGTFALHGEEGGPIDLRVRLIGIEDVCVGVRLAEEDMPSVVIAVREDASRRSGGIECVALEPSSEGAR